MALEPSVCTIVNLRRHARKLFNELKDRCESDEEVFLDDITLEQLKEKLNIQVITCQNEGKDFVEKIVY